MSLILFALVGIPLLLLLTDRLGWTTMYGKKKGTFLGSAMLGMDQLFAHQERREAMMYRLEDKRQLQQPGNQEDKENKGNEE
ncbi:MAG: hypothetical protein ACM3YO_00985 [Bacteroidota bacterium]